MSIAARNGSNAIITSAGVDLTGGGAVDEVSLTMPAGTASVTAHIAFDGPGTVSLARCTRPCGLSSAARGARTSR
jgi:hypothetical protein